MLIRRAKKSKWQPCLSTRHGSSSNGSGLAGYPTAEGDLEAFPSEGFVGAKATRSKRTQILPKGDTDGRSHSAGRQRTRIVRQGHPAPARQTLRKLQAGSC